MFDGPPRTGPRAGRRAGRAGPLTAALGLGAAALAGCDGTAEVVEFDAVNVTPTFDRSVFQPGGMGAEIHNAPLPGMSRSGALELVALPAGLARNLDLPLIEPGGWARAEHGRLIRLALLFDPAAQVGGDALCAAEAPLPSAESPENAYDVQMALCFRETAIAEGRMHAERAEPIDAAFVTRTLTRLFEEVFGAGPGA